MNKLQAVFIILIIFISFGLFSSPRTSEASFSLSIGVGFSSGGYGNSYYGGGYGGYGYSNSYYYPSYNSYSYQSYGYSNNIYPTYGYYDTRVNNPYYSGYNSGYNYSNYNNYNNYRYGGWYGGERINCLTYSC